MQICSSALTSRQYSDEASIESEIDIYMPTLS